MILLSIELAMVCCVFVLYFASGLIFRRLRACDRHLNPSHARARQFLSLLFMLVAASLTPSLAIAAPSDACNTINSLWASGATYSNASEQYQTNLYFNAGEVIHYNVQTSGNTNDPVTAPTSGGGFAIYSDSENNFIYEEYGGLRA